MKEGEGSKKALHYNNKAVRCHDGAAETKAECSRQKNTTQKRTGLRAKDHQAKRRRRVLDNVIA